MAAISGRKTPKTQIPFWVAMGAACANQFITGQILRRHPKIPVAASKNPCQKEVLLIAVKPGESWGLKPGPVQQAFVKSINWFKEEGYVRP
ncbi:MAG: hypothetical protein U5N58_01995 [Actinomycetota bacterium]|nr:hypothetical protein [Actinomycetota bacterium]